MAKTIYPRLLPHVEYSITEDGRSLMPIVRMLEQWENGFRPKMIRILKEEGDKF
ncbi:winged helix-turn-helix transcriptional regulator [Bacteroides gallinaceum]|uniref:winged helix-turn-helix transcriptional regulator n=1 Tax=Bacteroides gallinaceum TaxID=1462571 RepID=UPI001EF6F684|nr:winged helix-turn-helix transcriptional regulator [Bacteroides gallinaceum]